MFTYPIMGTGESSLLTDLVSWWALEEGAGPTWVDSHSSNDMTIIRGGPIDNAGKVNQAVYFGGGGTMGTGTGTTAYGSAKNFSTALWVNVSTFENNDILITNSSNITSAATSFSMQMHTGSAFKFTVSNAGGYYAAITAGSKSTGTWYFIYGQYDVDNDEVSISIDNGSLITAAVTGALTDGSGRKVSLGGHPTASINNSVCVIDEVGFWNRLLTASEISALYDSGDGITYTDLS